MYPFLDRRLRKLSTETLFTPFGFQMNKLEEEKRGKSDKFEHFEHYAFIIISKMFFLLYLDSTLSNLSNDTKITQNRVRMKKL